MNIAGIICADCGKPAPRTGQTQKYCVPCSEARDFIRKRLWVRENKPAPEKLAAKLRKRHENTLATGLEISRAEATSIADAPQAPELDWYVRVAIPFAYAGSKNHIYAKRRFGHVALRAESRAMRDEIVWRLKEALSNVRVSQNKIWLDIFVQKANHKGDATNFLDLICDAAKVACGVDDRWFSVRQIDWQIVKDNPRIFVGLGQEAVEDAIACSSCGRILPLTAFPKNRSAKYGISRNCKECRREKPRKANGALVTVRAA